MPQKSEESAVRRREQRRLVRRVDLNEGCFIGVFQYFPENSVFLGNFQPKFRENTEKN